MKAEALLQKVIMRIGEQRRVLGEDSREMFCDIASMWSTYLGHSISPHDVAMMMALLKIVRAGHRIKSDDDDAVDLAGYAAIASEVDHGVEL